MLSLPGTLPTNEVLGSGTATRASHLTSRQLVIYLEGKQPRQVPQAVLEIHENTVYKSMPSCTSILSLSSFGGLSGKWLSPKLNGVAVVVSDKLSVSTSVETSKGLHFAYDTISFEVPSAASACPRIYRSHIPSHISSSQQKKRNI